MGLCRTSARGHERQSALLLALAALALFAAAPARADVRIVPADDGHIGAWLLSGPHPRSRADELRAVPPAGFDRAWPRFVASAAGSIDLRKALGTNEGDRAAARLGGVLELTEPLHGWLLLSSDGPLRVAIEGSVVYETVGERARTSAWAAIPLTLAAGSHWIVLELQQAGRDWGFAARVLDARDLLPPSGLRLALPGVELQPVAAELVATRCKSGVTEAGYRPEVEVAFPRGAPEGADRAVQIRLDLGGSGARYRLGAIAESRGVHTLSARLPLVPASALPDETRLSMDIAVAGVERRCELRLTARAPAALAAATRAQQALAASQPHVEVLQTTLALARKRLVEATGDAGLAAARALAELASELGRGVNRVEEPGVWELARPSDLDGRPQTLQVHVPGSYDPRAVTTRRYPLVLVLHGWNGTPASVMRAFLDGGGPGPLPDMDGFVIAPQAHDNSFYRGAGEHEVVRTLDWALATYPIDPERVTITGVSMGGTGAAQIALGHAGRFAAAAPLCGYHSYFVRRDLRGLPVRRWELALMDHWSPASWAPNGRNLALYVAQGTQDRPLENSRVLVRAYRALGYRVTDEWPEAKHDVWRTVWANRKQWAWLSRQRREREPKAVSLVTDQLRYGELDWVRVTELTEPGKLGRVDARVTGPSQVEVTTTGVTGLELTPPRHDAGSLVVTVDGTTLSFARERRAALVRRPGGWEPGSPASTASRKRRGLEGPIHDVFLGPVVFVYGSGLPSTARANREIARRFASSRDGASVEYPVLADQEVDEALADRVSLVLVGTARDNAVLARVEARLPIRVEEDAIVVGGQRHDGAELGVIFVHPNPDHPHRYVLVIAAPTLGGLYRTLSLPKLLPDFVVFDAALAPAAGQHILGAAKVRAAGFFGNDWSLPQEPGDTIVRQL